MTELLQLIVNGLVTGSIIAITAVGLTLVYGILRIVNFAHGEYLTIGAFAAFALNVTFGRSMVVSTIGAMLATAALSVTLEFGLWRPMRRKGAGVASLFITSIGLALVLRHLVFLEWGARPRRFAVDVFQVYRLGAIRVSRTQLIAILLAIVAIALTGYLLSRTRLGKAMRAVSDNPPLAAVAGIDVDRIAAATWLVAGALAGLGGVLQGLVQASFNPNMGFSLLLPIFAAVVLGGIGRPYGALAAGFVLGIVMELSTWNALAGGLRAVYKPVVAFTALILVLLFRPQGVFGKARIL